MAKIKNTLAESDTSTASTSSKQALKLSAPLPISASAAAPGHAPTPAPAPGHAPTPAQTMAQAATPTPTPTPAPTSAPAPTPASGHAPQPTTTTISANSAYNHQLLSINHVEKIFGNKNTLTKALDNVSLSIGKGEFVAVMGPSGSGKSTLLNCIATIEPVSSGTITLGNTTITKLKGNALSAYRRDKLGFIFQDSNLIDTLNAYENIALALTLKNIKAAEIDQKIQYLAGVLHIDTVLDKFPPQMSGGERQRVAAVRAIIAQPELILADEPTGALDSKNSTTLLETLSLLNKNMHASILMVTHDAYAASYTSRTIFIRDGKVFDEVFCGNNPRETYYQRILNVVSFLGGSSNVL